MRCWNMMPVRWLTVPVPVEATVRSRPLRRARPMKASTVATPKSRRTASAPGARARIEIGVKLVTGS